MLVIAALLTIALVAADLLDLTKRDRARPPLRLPKGLG